MNGLSLSIIHSEEKRHRRERLKINGVHFISNSYNDVDRETIFKRDNYKCVYCDVIDHLTLDHLIPRSFRYDYQMPYFMYNSPTNIVTSCRYCNEEKSNLPLEHFLDDHEEYKQRFYVRTLYVTDKIFEVLGLLEERKKFLEQIFSKKETFTNGMIKFEEDIESILVH